MKKIFLSILIFLIILLSILIVSRKYIQGKDSDFYVVVKMSVGNILPEVADSINIGDYLIDSDGNKIFVVIDKIEKYSEVPVETSDGRILKVSHPINKSLYLTVKSTKPSKKLVLSYNRVSVRIGGKIIFETSKTRFVGTILSLDKE
ncbi:MAG TPA: DUF4330 family protein [Caldisericia bacterium]|nr:DUF4330 family protein [Caldisericia bacterium]HOC52486.1 DUF4330 family protein [Caldisericia bacterium]HPB33541.1 DUF4330 family protein [Caldisericia bacterium]HQL66504.1 DUF4330 family protein [Caldisericia bacterium]HQN48070.1 DUF4330 family protein [Caldisericia bacterium]